MKELTNPFIISEKIIPKYFCDRKNESHNLIELIKNGNNVVLISPRRVGKTGLIQFCFEHKSIKKDYLTIYIDILSTSNLQEFCYLLGKEILSEIRPLGKKLIQSFLEIVKSLSSKIGYDPLTGTPYVNFQLGDITQPDLTLKEIFNYLAKASKPCLVAIDEFQQVAKYSEGNVEARLRTEIQTINNCRFIFSGSERHILEEMFLSPAKPFYNSCSMMELKVIPKEIYVDFICGLFEDFRKFISRELAGKIYDLFEGLTFYVQRVSNGIFSMTPENGVATEGMFEDTMSNILSSYDTIFRERLFRITTRQKELLFAIAKEGKVEQVLSVDFIRKYSLSSSSAVQSALNSLMKQELISKEMGKYFISERFFALWLTLNY